MKKIITVDGPAGSGKSTIAKLLAKRINFSYLDTGSLYRSLSYYLLENKVSPKDPKRIKESLKSIDLNIEKDSFFLNGEDISEKIRTENVNKHVPLFAQLHEVRSFIRHIQKRIAENEHFIIDGRDIGTVVFKDAFCKFYLDASPEIRAQRRLNDEKEDTKGKKLEDIEKEIIKRDETDKNRTDSPLKIPVDALLIDSSSLSIDSVMEKMVNHYNKCLSETTRIHVETDTKDSKMFLNALEHFETKTFVPQTLIKATIINIKEKEIILDVGSKRDGVIAGEEMRKLDVASLKKGMEIDVFILKASTSSPQIFVSKIEADKRRSLIELKDLFQNNKVVEGIVSKSVKGGFLVDVANHQSFCPYSEYDVKKVNVDAQLGKKEKFYLIEMNGPKIIVSRKKHLEEIYHQIKEDFFETVHAGDLLNGTVVHIAKFGAFVEIKEGVVAILRPKDISWKRYNNISDALKKGDKITVKVLIVKKDTHKLEVSKKDAEEDPIISFQNFHNVGDVIKGIVMNLQDFGAFIEVASGLEGLLHVSELSWTKRVNHPKEFFTVGDEVEVKILVIDAKKRKISLGLKQITDDPWQTIEQRYPKGDIVSAQIKSIINSGIHCEIDGEFGGFVHASDISWTSDRIKLNSEFKIGEFRQVKVIGYEKNKRKIKLGIKQQSSNPWENLKNNYGMGGNIKGEVVKMIESGAFVKVIEELEGFCHISQASEKAIEKIEEAFEVGKTYNFAIQKIDEENKKLALSVKQYLLNEDKKNIEKYLSDGKVKNTISLGDLIKE